MEKSHFLQKELKRDLEEEERLREFGFNPRLLRGRMLSDFWRNGDTIYSVTWKKFRHVIYTVFNPDTYTWENLDDLTDNLILYRRTIIPYMI